MKDNIKIKLKGTWSLNVNGIHFAQERNQWRTLVTTIMNRRVSNYGETSV
jgi:hypothetical protein